MKTVRISVQHETDESLAGVEVFVDGAKVGGGYFGGEPEDNSIFRDYKWVVPLLEELARKVGAVVLVETGSP